MQFNGKKKHKPTISQRYKDMSITSGTWTDDTLIPKSHINRDYFNGSFISSAEFLPPNRCHSPGDPSSSKLQLSFWPVGQDCLHSHQWTGVSGFFFIVILKLGVYAVCACGLCAHLWASAGSRKYFLGRALGTGTHIVLSWALISSHLSLFSIFYLNEINIMRDWGDRDMTCFQDPPLLLPLSAVGKSPFPTI